MDVNKIRTAVIETASKEMSYFYRGPLKDETRLVEDCKASPLDIVDLAMALESEFYVEISDSEIEALQTVSDVVSCVTKEVRKNALAICHLKKFC